MEIVAHCLVEGYDIKKEKDGYSVFKVYIYPDKLKYKLKKWKLEPGLYEKFEKFYELWKL